MTNATNSKRRPPASRRRQPGRQTQTSTRRHVRIRTDEIHARIPREASRGARVAAQGPRGLVGSRRQRAHPARPGAPLAEGGRQRIPLRTACRQAAGTGKAIVSAHLSNVRPKPDKVLTLIADYAKDFEIKSEEAYATARYCLMDTLGCGFEALEYPACTKLLGPVVKGTMVPNGARVPRTQFQLDPLHAAFNIGAMIRWLDFNDT